MPMMAWSIINNEILRNSQDKSYTAQNTNDIKFSRYKKIIVIGLNSEQKKTKLLENS